MSASIDCSMQCIKVLAHGYFRLTVSDYGNLQKRPFYGALVSLEQVKPIFQLSQHIVCEAEMTRTKLLC